MIRDLQQDIKQKEKKLYQKEIASTCQKETFDRTFEPFQAQILQLEADKTIALNSAARNIHTSDSSQKLDTQAKGLPAHVPRTAEQALHVAIRHNHNGALESAY